MKSCRIQQLFSGESTYPGCRANPAGVLPLAEIAHSFRPLVRIDGFIHLRLLLPSCIGSQGDTPAQRTKKLLRHIPVLPDFWSAQGVHLYIFLTPRTHLCPLAHALAYGVHVLIFVLLRDRVAA
jgi:hypothetical protein